MKALLQRVTQASVTVDNQVIGEIDRGLLVFLGVEKTDDEQICRKLIDKLLSYRVFPDDQDKMNLNVQDINGSLLIVSQFTLVAETQKGTRPGFSKGASPEHGENLYNYFINEITNKYPHIETGKFGADMKVALLNDGPVTFLLEAK